VRSEPGGGRARARVGGAAGRSPDQGTHATIHPAALPSSELTLIQPTAFLAIRGGHEAHKASWPPRTLWWDVGQRTTGRGSGQPALRRAATSAVKPSAASPSCRVSMTTSPVYPSAATVAATI